MRRDTLVASERVPAAAAHYLLDGALVDGLDEDLPVLGPPLKVLALGPDDLLLQHLDHLVDVLVADQSQGDVQHLGARGAEVRCGVTCFGARGAGLGARRSRRMGTGDGSCLAADVHVGAGEGPKDVH